MKLDPKYKPELCVSDDEERFNLTLPYLDAKAKTIAATNGHLLVVVPVELDEGEKSRHVVQPELDRARYPVSPAAEDIARDRGVFPDVIKVVPPFKPFSAGTVTVGFSAEYLFRLSQALGTEQSRVVLTFVPGCCERDEGAILVTAGEWLQPGDAFGVLMPLRLSDPRPRPPRPMTPGEEAQLAEEESKAVAEAERAAQLLVLEARKKALLERAARVEEEIEELTAPPPEGEVARG